jgi:superfamily I DNA/RNA helicase
MHGAKGLELRAVILVACDEDIVADPALIGSVGDQSDLEAIYDTERHLLYVAFTRARDRLFVSAVAPGSEFLDDIR